MIACKYYEQRYVKANVSSSTDFSALESDYFHMVLIKSGYAVMETNHTNICLNGSAVLLIKKGSPLNLLYENQLNVCLFSFHPSFFNINLSWDVLERPDYLTFASEYEFPAFTPFLKIGKTPNYHGFFPISPDYRDILTVQLQSIHDQLTSQPTPNWSCSARSYLIRILDELDLLYKNYTDNNRDTPPLIRQITDFIELNLSSDLSLSDLCKRFHTNRTTLSNLFKFHTELTIHQYINMRRLELVRNALLFTSLSLEEIAERYGFQHASYLSRLFKNHFHMSPIQYRKQEVERRKRGVNILKAY